MDESLTAKIFIVEDEALIAAEIKSTLELLGHKVVGHAMNGDKALDELAKQEAELILLDINIKGTRNGIDLAHIIRDRYKVPFVFLTSFSDRLTLEKVKDTMPYGYIVKPFNEHDLKVNIELALHKHNLEVSEISFDKSFIERKLDISLTDREFSILSGFREGLTYKQIGERNFISTNTVKTYQKRLFSLMKVGSKFELLKKIG